MKASVLQSSAFFMVQLSHPYMSTGKIIALIIRIFLSKVMSLLFTMLSRFVITFFPRSKCLSILWLKSTVSLEPKKIKSATVSSFSPFICHEVMRLDAVILIFYMLYFKPAFILYSFTLIRKLFSSSSLSAIYSSIICISEIVNISPGNFYFSLWFIQPSISHDVLCI